MKKKCRALLLAVGMLFGLSACGQSEQLPTVEERLLAIYNGEVSVEEAEARGWLDKEFNDWIQSMMEQASVIGSFEASNLEGEPITEEIFADYDLTMVNLWTTTCGYCIEEMPTLEKIRREIQEDGTSFNIVGMCLDINNTGEVDEEKLEKAQLIADTAEITYETIIPDAALWSGRLQGVSAVPETFFVDRDGNIVGQTVLGAKTEEQWRTIIETELAALQAE